SMPGWLTDRGKVFMVLGEPDQIYDQQGNDFAQRGRTQLWEYRNANVQLQFFDQTGFGRWRLTQQSEAQFDQVWRRVVR
ncbi:MAG: GWxTD domain-containing protein, partial [Gemmatimonadaceae bacterium]|nr:GWxTD domain-containing protein [Gemmatimonadaceae bacterium]